MPDTAAESGKCKSCSLPWVLVVLLLLGIGVYAAYASRLFGPKLRIAIVTSGDTPYWDRVAHGAKDAADELDVDLTIVRPQTDADAQSEEIQRLIDSGRWDGIAISPISLTRQTVLFGRVAAKTTVVTMDSDLPVSRRLCFVGTDNYAAGREMGRQIRQAIPDGGEVIVSIGQADKENTLRRRQGLIDDLCDRTSEPLRPFDPLDKPLSGSKYTIVTTIADGSDPANATELAADAIRKHPNLKCLAGMLSYSAPALVAAVEKEKAVGRVAVIGFDVSDQTLELIEQGKVASTTMQDQYGLGYNSVRILVDNARHNIGGLPMYQQHALSSNTVTKENVALARRRLAGEPVSLSVGAPADAGAAETE